MDRALPSFPSDADSAIGWLRIVPFIGLHVACFATFAVGVSAAALAVAVVSYLLRAFAVSAFYHRCFSHRAFRAGRVTQFVFAALAAAATQRGPLWWAAHHRMHHAKADSDADPHSPGRGFWWSHMGWFLTKRHFRTPLLPVRDLARLPELRWLNRFDLIAPIAYGALMFGLGEALGPDFGTNGWQMLVWGYVVSTVALMHATFLVNSIAHRPAPFRRRQRPFATRDSSRNLWWLALITMGEGWHNNHHRHAGAARLGVRTWQVDLAWLGLKLLAWLGLVTDLKPAPMPEERRCASR